MVDKVRYLRVSLLKGCNFNCFYCRPQSDTEVSHPKLTRPDEFMRAIKFLYRAGIRKVRFTGGEPTLYKELPGLITGVKTLDRDIHTAVTTNGFLLDRLASRLAEAGLDSVNISLDTLNRERFKAIAGVDGIERVLAGIRAARRYIRQVKLNCVIMERVNSDEPPRMIELADRFGVDIRFIEYMPTKHNTSQRRGYVSGDTVRQNLPLTLYPLETEATSAARYYTSDKLKIRVGFINPVSHPFCDHCDRLRLTADGRLHGCLFSDRAIDLFELLNNDHDTALDETMKLIASKVRAGCLVSNRTADYLPSFVNIGG